MIINEEFMNTRIMKLMSDQCWTCKFSHSPYLRTFDEDKFNDLIMQYSKLLNEGMSQEDIETIMSL